MTRPHTPPNPRSTLPLRGNQSCGWKPFTHPAVLMLHTDSCSRTDTESACLLITELTHWATMYFGPCSQNTSNSVAATELHNTCTGSFCFKVHHVADITFHKRQQTLKVFPRLTFPTEFFVLHLEKTSTNTILFCLCLQKPQKEHVKDSVCVFLCLGLCTNGILSSLSDQSRSKIFQMWMHHCCSWKLRKGSGQRRSENGDGFTAVIQPLLLFKYLTAIRIDWRGNKIV